MSTPPIFKKFRWRIFISVLFLPKGKKERLFLEFLAQGESSETMEAPASLLLS